MRRRSWKRCEQRVAQALGGERIPVTGRRGPDVAHPWLAVEVKARADLPRYLWDWLAQARAGAPADKLPILVLHPAGWTHGKDLVVLKLADFKVWFGG